MDFVITLADLLTFYLVAGLVGVCSLWYYYDRRDKRYYDRQRLRRCFHCIKCGHLYSSQKGGQKITCPNCEFQNPPLRF